MLSSLMLMTALAAASPATAPAPARLTRAERTRFEETSRYGV